MSKFIHNQEFTSEEFGRVIFRDKRQNIHSADCQPRDIDIISGPNLRAIREEIAVDIRINQNGTEIGSRKNLRF